MTLLTQRKYGFESRGMDKDTFSVVSFTGFEAISKPYEFEIRLVSEHVDIDSLAVLENPATFTIYRDEKEDVAFNGILIQFQETREFNGFRFFRAVLAPKIKWLSLTHHNQVFINKSVPEIMAGALKDGGLFSGIDFEFSLKGPGEKLGKGLEYDEYGYPRREYVSQYDESHFAFVSRWAEREGIYYFFEQTADGEKVVFTDYKIRHEDLPLGKDLVYDPPSGLASLHTDEVIHSFVCNHNLLPKTVHLKDYNYLKPSQTVEGIADVDEKGRGKTYVYGVHFDTVEEGNRLAEIRAEALKCRKSEFHGESSVPFLQPGFTFDLARHYNDIYNRKYLVTRITHTGHQTGYLISGLSNAVTRQDEKMSYANSFTAIYSDAQFRPEHMTKKPKVNGTINAKVDGPSGGSTAYAQLDGHGRYLVKLPFDLSGTKDGHGSARFRMMQPYAGENQGFHFPLKNGTEVLLTFIDGNPDRPVIAGAVPNPEKASPVTEKNQTSSVIRTRPNAVDRSAGAGDARARENSYNENFIEFEDSRPRIRTYSSGTIEARADERYERRIYGTSEVSGHDRYNGAGDDRISASEAGTKVDGMLQKIEYLAPGNVLGYDEGAELPEKDSAVPHHFPWRYVKAPVPDVPDTFTSFFEDTPEIWCHRDNDTDNYNWEKLDGLYDSKDDAWKAYWQYWVQRKHADAKGYGRIAYNDPLNNTDRPLTKPWYFESWATQDDKWLDVHLNDYRGDLEDHCQKEWNAWVKKKRADLRKWQVHTSRGHFRVNHRDSFKRREGNVYDFSGYHSYRLGDHYKEEHVDQENVDLNSHDDFDMLDKGGPHWTDFRTIQSGLSGGSGNDLRDHFGKGNWDPGKVYVHKRWGDTYEYVKGSKISVVDGNSHKIVIGGKIIEEKYGTHKNGEDKIKKRWYRSGGGITQEKKWTNDGTLLLNSYKATYGVNNAQKFEAVYKYGGKSKVEWRFQGEASLEGKMAGYTKNKVFIGGKSENSLSLDASLNFKYSLGTKNDVVMRLGADHRIKFYGGEKLEMPVNMAINTKIPASFAINLKFPFYNAGKVEVGMSNGLMLKALINAAVGIELKTALLKATMDEGGGFKVLAPGVYAEKKPALDLKSKTFHGAVYDALKAVF